MQEQIVRIPPPSRHMQLKGGGRKTEYRIDSRGRDSGMDEARVFRGNWLFGYPYIDFLLYTESGLGRTEQEPYGLQTL